MSNEKMGWLSAFHSPAQKRALEFLFGEYDSNGIYVDVNSPVQTVAQALSLVTKLRKNIYLPAGTYIEPKLIWPDVGGVRLISTEQGSGALIHCNDSTGPALTINPTWAAGSGTFEAFLENVFVEHTAQVGIEIDNANNPSSKTLIHLIGVGTNQVSTGDSIHSTHTNASQPIRIYATRCDEIEGLTNLVTANVDDRYRFMQCVLTGGLTATGAIASELTFLGTQMKTSGLTFDATMVETNAMCWYRTDAGVYSAWTDAYSA